MGFYQYIILQTESQLLLQKVFQEKPKLEYYNEFSIQGLQFFPTYQLTRGQ